MLSLSKHAHLAGVIALTSCSQTGGSSRGEAINCALDGSIEFTRDCTLERNEAQLIIHHPDGGFRRFEFRDPGVVAADGAEEPAVEILADGAALVSISGDRYRIPSDE